MNLRWFCFISDLPVAPCDGLFVEWQWQRRPDVYALLEEALPESVRHEPFRAPAGADHEEGGDGAAGEGDDLEIKTVEVW